MFSFSDERDEKMVPYHTKIRCYDCGRSIKEKLYLEREVRPDAQVPICDYCEPIWGVLRRMEEKGLIESTPKQGVALTPWANLAYVPNI